jgi:hypothetical protein
MGYNAPTLQIYEDWYDHDGFVYVGEFQDNTSDQFILTLVALNGGRYKGGRKTTT